MRFYDAVAFGVERDGADWRPVSGVARPAGRIEFASAAVEPVSGSQYRQIVLGMAPRFRVQWQDAVVAHSDPGALPGVLAL